VEPNQWWNFVTSYTEKIIFWNRTIFSHNSIFFFYKSFFFRLLRTLKMSVLLFFFLSLPTQIVILMVIFLLWYLLKWSPSKYWYSTPSKRLFFSVYWFWIGNIYIWQYWIRFNLQIYWQFTAYLYQSYTENTWKCIWHVY
jgi:hypothetical protein